MAIPLVEVAFKLTGRGFDPDDVTKVIQLTPTETWRLGDYIQWTALKRKHDGWEVGLPERETYGMEEILLELLDALDPHNGRIAEAVERLNLETEISFGVYVRGETPAGRFSAETIRRVSALGAILDIDLILSE
jgi:Domain of unknown function (DUF4279)